jgi:hypothetical protein
MVLSVVRVARDFLRGLFENSSVISVEEAKIVKLPNTTETDVNTVDSKNV